MTDFTVQVLSWIGVALVFTYRRYFMKLEEKRVNRLKKHDKVALTKWPTYFKMITISTEKDEERLDICIKHIREDNKTLTRGVKAKVFSWIGIASKDTYQYYDIIIPKTTQDRVMIIEWIAKEKEMLTQWTEQEKETFTEWKGKEMKSLTEWMEKQKEMVSDWKRREKESLTRWTKGENETITVWKSKEKDTLTQWMHEEKETFIGWMEKEKETFSEWERNEKERLSQWMKDKIKSFTDSKEKERKMLSEWMKEEKETFSEWKKEEKETFSECIKKEKDTFTTWRSKEKRTLSEWIGKEQETLLQRINDEIAPDTAFPYCLSFKYQMRGDHIGSLEVLAGDKTSSLTSIWKKVGEQTIDPNHWDNGTIDIQQFSNLVVTIVGSRGIGPKGDIAIDDILF